MNTDFLVKLGAGLKAERKKSGLTQSAVGLALGLKPPGGHSYVSCLETGKMGNVGIETVMRYLRACKAPIGKFMLELAQSGAFGESEAEDVRGFTPQRLRGETSNEEAKRARAKLRYDKRWEREVRDADTVARLWLEVLAAMQPLLPPDPTRFMAHYLEVVRGFYRAWKLATRGARDQDATQAVQLAFDRIEQNAVEHLVPAAVRGMREVVFSRLMERTTQGGNT